MVGGIGDTVSPLMKGKQMKEMVLATAVLMAMAGGAGAETSKVFPLIPTVPVFEERPALSHIVTHLDQPYSLRYRSGERRVLIDKDMPGVETLVDLMIGSGVYVVERNDPGSLTFVYRPN
jgi:hypothetical protein